MPKSLHGRRSRRLVDRLSVSLFDNFDPFNFLNFDISTCCGRLLKIQ